MTVIKSAKPIPQKFLDAISRGDFEYLNHGCAPCNAPLIAAEHFTSGAGAGTDILKLVWGVPVQGTYQSPEWDTALWYPGPASGSTDKSYRVNQPAAPNNTIPGGFLAVCVSVGIPSEKF